jgi:DNA-binding NarL/FixJ family response regulator
MTTDRYFSVYICDLSEIVVLGIRTQLEKLGISVLGTTTEPARAVTEVAQLMPQVLIMDLNGPAREKAIEAIRRIKEQVPDVAVLVFTATEDEIDFAEILNVGADGYCTKSLSGEELLLALETISRGNAWLHKPIKDRVLNRGLSPPAVARKRTYKASESQLSPREREILMLITTGMTNNQIAAELHISPDTVKTHVRNIMDKLQCKDRTAMAVKAVTEGIM